MSSLLAYISYNPIVRIHLWKISLSPHGIGIYIGYLAGAYVFFIPAARKKGISDDDSFLMLILGLLGAAIGARFFYVVNHWNDFPSFLDTLKVWQGGLSLLGGITGAIVFNIPLWRKRGFGFFPVMDAAAPGIALGLIFGRLGDLAIADHLGKTTSFFFGYRCPSPAIVGQTVGSPCTPGTTVHSTALYDLVSVVALLIVLVILKRRDHYPGFLACVFGFWYGIGRVVEDFLRVDKRIFGLTGSQWTALVVLIYTAYVLFIRRRSPGWGMGKMKDGLYHGATEPIVDLDAEDEPADETIDEDAGKSSGDESDDDDDSDTGEDESGKPEKKAAVGEGEVSD